MYLERGADIATLMPKLTALEGIAYAAPRAQACRDFELPADRIGDVVVVSDRHTVLGKAPEDHDLSLLEGGCGLTAAWLNRTCRLCSIPH